MAFGMLSSAHYLSKFSDSVFEGNSGINFGASFRKFKTSLKLSFYFEDHVRTVAT